MIKEVLAVILVILASVFFYTEASSNIDPTTSTFFVDDNWNESGTLNNLVNSDILYVDGTSETGSWTSFIQEEDRSRVVSIDMIGDPRNGNVNLTVNMWSESVEGDPDNSTTLQLEGNELEETLAESKSYDFFEFVIDIEDEGSVNTRPNVDSLDVVFERESGPGLPELFLAVMIFGAFAVFLKRF